MAKNELIAAPIIRNPEKKCESGSKQAQLQLEKELAEIQKKQSEQQLPKPSTNNAIKIEEAVQKVEIKTEKRIREAEKITIRPKNPIKFYSKYSDYQFLDSNLGEGAYATVRSALHLPSGKKVAFKTYSPDQLDERDKILTIYREIDIIKRLNHPNICMLYETI